MGDRYVHRGWGAVMLAAALMGMGAGLWAGPGRGGGARPGGEGVDVAATVRRATG